MKENKLTVTLRPAAPSPNFYRPAIVPPRLKRYAHPDGGTYVIADDFSHSMKMDDSRWEPAVAYRRVTKIEGRWAYEGYNVFHTTKGRWAERFTEMPDE